VIPELRGQHADHAELNDRSLKRADAVLLHAPPPQAYSLNVEETGPHQRIVGEKLLDVGHRRAAG
jgi:hypothetical protein